MRVGVVCVGADGGGSSAGNRARLAVLAELVGQARAAGVDLLVLPAGFLTVGREDQVVTVLRPMGPRLDAMGVSVLLGVDVDAPGGPDSRLSDELAIEGALPWFAVAWTPAGVVGPWRQRSTTAAHARLGVPGTTDVRAVEVGGRAVGVLLCGEVFNAAIRDRVASHGAEVAVVIGHAGAGPHLHAGLAALTRAGAGAVEHAFGCYQLDNAPGRQAHFTRGGGNDGRRARDLWVRWKPGSPWAAGAIFAV